MLRNTFCHMPGIGPKAEALLWRHGVLDWAAAARCSALPVSEAKADIVMRHSSLSLARVDARDARHFAAALPSRLHWRLFPEFRGSVAYLDIETTGLGGSGDYITCIGLYDGRRVHTYVHGRNLDQFRDDVRDYALLVTYNGEAFDLPFIRQCMRLPMDQAHVDLRYVLHSLGYKGGLKGCEKQLGLERGELDGVDGYFAVLLWRDYRATGDRHALETLLAYNAADVVNLEALMVMAYNMKLRETPFAATHRLPLPSPPAIPWQPHAPTIRRIRGERGWL